MSLHKRPEPQPIPVIYILACGRSGSTLLDLMLDQHPEMESVGEVHHLDRWLSQNLLCSCSQPIDACRYWAKVLEAADLTTAFQVGEPSRARRLKADAGWTDTAYTEAYTNKTETLFQAILATTGRSIVVDSSKTLYRARILQASKRCDVRFIHLIRNGKAYVNSWRTPVARPAASGQVQVRTRSFGPFTATRRWVLNNLAMDRFIRQLPPGHGTSVRYEALAQNPDTVLRRLCTDLNLDFDTAMCTPSTLDIHNISGSRWRMQPQTSVDIRLDDRWRRELPATSAWIFDLIGGAAARKFGYGSGSKS